MTIFKTFTDHKEEEAFLIEQMKKQDVKNTTNLLEKLFTQSKTYSVMIKRGYHKLNLEFLTEVDELNGLILSIIEARKVARKLPNLKE